MKKLLITLSTLLLLLFPTITVNAASSGEKDFTDIPQIESDEIYEESEITGLDSVDYTSNITKIDASLDAWATYKLNKKYYTFSGKILGSTSSNTGGCYTINLYGDNKLLFSKKNFAISEKPIKFNINVSDVRTLKITSSNSGSWGNGWLFMVDAKMTTGKLTLNINKTTLNCGDSIFLSASSTGSGAKGKTTWKSSNKTIAKVSSKGKVVAVNPGVCTITCKKGSFSVKATIIVKPKKVTTVSVLSKSKNAIQLQWKKQAGAKGYQVVIYDKDLEEYTPVKSTSFNNLYVSGLKKKTYYKFKIRAYVKDGSKKVYGAYSKVFTAKTK